MNSIINFLFQAFGGADSLIAISSAALYALLVWALEGLGALLDEAFETAVFTRFAQVFLDRLGTSGPAKAASEEGPGEVSQSIERNVSEYEAFEEDRAADSVDAEPEVFQPYGYVPRNPAYNPFDLHVRQRKGVFEPATGFPS